MQPTFHMTREYRKNGITMREYVARLGKSPIDRFSIFLSPSGWTAWTADTFSESAKLRRARFAETVGA